MMTIVNVLTRFVRERFQQIVRIFQVAGNLGLYESLRKLQDENQQLRERLQIVEENKLIERNLVFRDRVYWKKDETGRVIREPYCQKCWDAEQKLCHLDHVNHGKALWCRVCESSFGTAS